MTKRLLALLASCLLTMNLVADAGVTVNGVDVSAGSGEGWSCSVNSTSGSSTLTLSGLGPYVLSGENSAMCIRVTGNASLVLSNLVVEASGVSYSPIELYGNVSARIGLFGQNVLRVRSSSTRLPGLGVPSGTAVEIYALFQSDGGRLEAKGGDYCAGIGGKFRNAGGEIVISGGSVIATGGSSADALGRGANSASDDHVAILGGSVYAETIRNTPTNAVGQVLHCVTIPELTPNTTVAITGFGDYGTNGIVADKEGKIYLWLPGEALSPATYTFTANGVRYEATVKGEATTAVVADQLEPVGVFVDGEDVGLVESGTDWAYSASAHEIGLTGMGPFVVSGTNSMGSLSIVSEVGSRVKFLSFESDGLALQGPLEIAGGTVAATAIRGPISITGGSVACSSFELSPSNGSERVWCVTVTNLVPNTAVAVDGLTGYDTAEIVADAGGRIYLWLPDGDRIFAVNGERMRAIVDAADTVAEIVSVVTPTGVTVNGIDAAYGHGAGWMYVAPILSITDGRHTFMLSGTNEQGAVQVVVQANAMVTVSNLVLTSVSGSPLGIVAPFVFDLTLMGENRLQSGDRECPGLHIPVNAGINIMAHSNISGILSAMGGRYAAGIGGGDEEDAGTIGIQGGTIVAVMGSRGEVDIGGGPDGVGATVIISGGSVNAATIANAPVNAVGQAVQCVTVTNLVPGSVVRPSGLTGYDTSGIVADAAGRIYLWLPDGNHTFTAGGFRYEATVAGGAVTATQLGAASMAPSRLEVTAIEVIGGVARLEIATDLGDTDFAVWLESATFEVDFRAEPTGSVVQTLIPTREGTVLFVALPSSSQGFLTVRAR